MPATVTRSHRPKPKKPAGQSAYETGPLISNISHWKLKNIRIIGPFRLCLHFKDDFIAELDFEKWMKATAGGPLRKPLRDREYFAQVYLDHGALTWPNSFDISPEAVRHWAEQGFCD